LNEPKLTRCPGCATVFRVTPAQLALRDGQVRCGHCRAVFDANDHFVTLDIVAPEEFGADDELLRGRPTVTLRSADALLPVSAGEVTVPVPVADATPAVPAADAVVPAPVEDAMLPVPVADTLLSGPAGEPMVRAAAADEPVAAAPADERSTTEEPQRDEPDAQRTAVEATAGEGPAAEKIPTEGAAGEGAAREGTSGEGAAAGGSSGGGTSTDGAAGEGSTVEGAAGEGAAALGAVVAGAALATPAAGSGLAPEAPAADTVPIELRDADRPQRFIWKKRRTAGTPPKRLYVAGIVALSLAIVVQMVLEFRDALATHVPATRVLLAAACRALSCSVDPLKDPAALSIEASDLQADPAHRGLLVLSATIRNRASHPIAYPYLELTLTDSSERIVVRRAFAPHDYAGGTVDFQQGIAANGERLVKLFIDASATQQAGYQLYLFYP
jgi:predicted Zn finger-like uncharacterized protein